VYAYLISVLCIRVPQSIKEKDRFILPILGGGPYPTGSCRLCVIQLVMVFTYDASVLKLSNVSFRGKCACTGNPLKLPSPTKLARLGHFPPASQAGRLVGPVFYVYIFSGVDIIRLWRLQSTVFSRLHTMTESYCQPTTLSSHYKNRQLITDSATLIILLTS
jgi:hypothetical protein